MRTRCFLAGAVMAGALGSASTAEAYFGWANCYTYSAQTCWVGNGYRGNIEVDAELWYTARSEVCAKGVTAAGNIRTGSGCSYNTGVRDSYFSYHEPASAGYAYWAGSGSPYEIGVEECSPSDRVAICITPTAGYRG